MNIGQGGFLGIFIDEDEQDFICHDCMSMDQKKNSHKFGRVFVANMVGWDGVLTCSRCHGTWPEKGKDKHGK